MCIWGAFWLCWCITWSSVLSASSCVDSVASRYTALAQAELHLARGNGKAAYQSLSSVFTHGGDLCAKHVLWRVLAHTNQHELLAKQENIFKDDLELQLLFVQALLKVGKTDQVLSLVEQLRARHGDEPSLIMLLVSVYSMTGNAAQGLVLLQNYLDKNPLSRTQAQWYLVKAKLHYQARELAAATEALTHLLVLRPRFDKALLFRAMLFEEQKNMARACVDYQDYLAVHGYDATIHHHVVHALFVQQDYAHALQVHAQYEQPTADYWFDRALLQWKMHNITAAHQAIANAYTHDANYPAARLIELQLFFDEKRFDDITAALRAWLQADKTNALPVEALFLLRKEGMPAQPLQTMMHELIAQQGPCSLWLAALIDLAGTSSSAELDEQLNGCTRNTQAQQALRYKKAYQLLTAGNYNQLATYLDSLSSADLATSTFENLRAYFYAQTNNYLEQAHTLIEPLVRANPANAAYLDTYGFVYMRRGDAQKAKESFDKALAVEPGNSLVREHLSQL